ncbi:hypothetical protein, partial [Croceibacter atlanticus]|uniref:hypothetical protein n=1 Tax=Croceibacter atlanticus TaxID=313588 RepID=UPI0032B16416
WKGLRRLALRLANRSEYKAANQYATGLAGLALATRLPKMNLDISSIDNHANKLFSLQHSEGWFYEYGGPDFGYLTVTIDALTDYYDVTGDERAIKAIDKAIKFLADLVGKDGELPWTLNSRNTDYIVPYGIVRAAKRNSLSSWLVTTLFANLSKTSHWIWSTDDRYHLHYIFSSLARSLPHLKGII